MAEQTRESLVVVRADRTTLLERFVQVVDEVRGLGFQKISLEVAKQ
jgi:biopolymer transport protein ExbD